MGACTDTSRSVGKRKELGGPGERERSEVDGWGGSSGQARSNDNEGGERSKEKKRSLGGGGRPRRRALVKKSDRRVLRPHRQHSVGGVKGERRHVPQTHLVVAVTEHPQPVAMPAKQLDALVIRPRRND